MGFPLLLFFKSTFSLVYDVSCLYVWIDSMYMMCLALDKLMLLLQPISVFLGHCVSMEL